jgi:hypothetical protein
MAEVKELGGGRLLKATVVLGSDVAVITIRDQRLANCKSDMQKFLRALTKTLLQSLEEEKAEPKQDI